jgi:hypothetical protein
LRNLNATEIRLRTGTDEVGAGLAEYSVEESKPTFLEDEFPARSRISEFPSLKRDQNSLL